MALQILASFLSRYLGLTKIENHINVIALSIVSFHAVYLLGGLISRYWFENVYEDLSAKEKIVWRVKIVSFVHAVAISILAYPLLFDPHLMKNKVFGYTTYSGDVYAVTCGYFVWDIVYVLVQGQHMSFLLHGIACLAVFLYSYTPFLNYYGSAFLMFELSTPFLNLVYFMVTTIHGFGFEFASVFISNLFLQDKCSYSKTLLFKLNGIVLLLVFFLVRIVFGLYMSVKTFGNFFSFLGSNTLEIIRLRQNCKAFKLDRK
ncbi:hypothetical protein DSO57_1018299 [Entomophthora muscae]|uniref:Uncharacterized protein n=1 Tax=Entomophthora muscae TaxID=34485 RepID=A0ACC2UQ47_9FUNG|nr:hypothetical protein DSO57_1018299 [Entomophthora muscae]